MAVRVTTTCAISVYHQSVHITHMAGRTRFNFMW